MLSCPACSTCSSMMMCPHGGHGADHHLQHARQGGGDFVLRSSDTFLIAGVRSSSASSPSLRAGAVGATGAREPGDRAISR